MAPTSFLATIAAGLLLGVAVCADEPGCEAKCKIAGHCCVGAGSSCQKPSCAMGCIAAAHAHSEAACNASCTAAAPKKSMCSWPLPGTNITFNMCGDCVTETAPSWWPQAAKPTPGTPPGFWPPGYSLPQCGSCETIDNDPAGECKLGCLYTFRPSLKPQPPPVPQPPPARPKPPACGPFPSSQKGDLNPWSGCTAGASLNFSNAFGPNMVLQMAPAKTAVYGPLGSGASAGAKVSVTVAPASADTLAESYTVQATVTAGEQWKAYLKPTAAGGSYTITAKCESGCTGSVALSDVTFGDVWYCFGQSNMALPFQFSYARNATIQKIRAGKINRISITGLQGNMNIDQPWISLLDAVGGATNTTMPNYGDIPLDHFSSTCYYFGEGLVEGLASQSITDVVDLPAAAAAPIPIGLIHTAWGGSMIEQWLTNDAIAECKGAAITAINENLFDANVKPYAGQAVKGWVYYQGENNCGGLHGNSGTADQPPSGYACMMPKLVELFRKTWSVESGTTDPQAPFGVVSLSSHDSEGAQDMASFRWAQQGSYGTLPNKIMPNTFMAHAFDLQDPWNGNTGACEAKPTIPGGDPAGYDCKTPWYMGPGIHPRLKKPVGQRLALGALQAAYNKGKGAVAGVISGCSATATSLNLKFNMAGGRMLSIRKYNASSPASSATSVRVNGTWLPVHIALGSAPGTVAVDLSSLPAGSGPPTAVRYAWGATGNGGQPNGGDVSCCEGDGINTPCVPTQCPLLAPEPLAPFGALPIDPFLAEIKGGKCLCPEPQECSA